MTRRALGALFILLLLTACQPRWQAQLVIEGRESVFAASEWRALAKEWLEKEGAEGALPLERILWERGARAVEAISVDGIVFPWRDYYDSAWWLPDGQVHLGEQLFRPQRLEACTPALLAGVQASLMDVAPTALAALGAPPLASAEGRALTNEPASHVALIYLDGFGYLRYLEAQEAGDIPALTKLGAPLRTITAWPSATKIATAVLLTGMSPARNGVRDASLRSTAAETIFDLLQKQGRSAAAIEGSSLAFNLRSVSVELSGDLNESGSGDDEVLANALKAIDAGMPDLLWVHFHGFDDAGHTYGPHAPEEEETLRALDELVGQLLDALPGGTLAILFADHGMRVVNEDGRSGNHGSLLAEDMFVPLWLYRAR
jgi:hypothetical protein